MPLERGIGRCIVSKKENKIIYEDEDIKVSKDSYQWILEIDGEESYFGDIRNLFDSIMQANIKKKVKENFENLKEIVDNVYIKIEKVNHLSLKEGTCESKSLVD